MSLWNTLNVLANNKTISGGQKKEMLKNIDSSIDKSFAEYDSIPQQEKDKLCVNLAREMGCKSSDVIICAKFIKDYAWSR